MPGRGMPIESGGVVEERLNNLLSLVEKSFGGSDALVIHGPILFSVDDFVRRAVEYRRGNHGKGHLVSLVTTPGGFIEVVQRIVETLRHHYDRIDFVVPNYAYSAGTVLVMAGDDIHMDYYARLGPIDPQVPSRNGQSVSAMGYLERYERLLEKGKRGRLSQAEAALLVEAFDQGELSKYKHERDQSIALLKTWLATYKFKDWTITQGRGLQVTSQMREKRAAEIAKELNNIKRWHIHGQGISMDVLQSELKLLIRDFGTNQKRRNAIRSYQDLLTDYMGARGSASVVHVKGRYTPYTPYDLEG